MATISKFYFHNAATTNTGTMPGAGDAYITDAGRGDVTGDAAGARTARSADDTIGVAETNSVITATANVLGQGWGHRRFVSAPLAAHTFDFADGNWTFSYAVNESNTNHNGVLVCDVYSWRPSTGARVGATGDVHPFTSITSTTKTAAAPVATWQNGPTTILDGDILVFEVYDNFTQGMSVAYTSTFYYDGTTEASTTSCATFMTPPAALTLFTSSMLTAPIRVTDQAVNRSSVY